MQEKPSETGFIQTKGYDVTGPVTYLVVFYQLISFRTVLVNDKNHFIKPLHFTSNTVLILHEKNIVKAMHLSFN